MTSTSAASWWPIRCRNRLAAAILLGLALQGAAAEDPPQKPAPVAQPLPFSHKQHRAAGLECVDCHAGAKTEDVAGLPAERKCMFCHVRIRTDSPAIRQLAAAQKAGGRIHWVRVYKLPDIVFFSHGNHAKAGIECVTCHGLVAERDVLALEVPAKMQTCVECHRGRQASTECSLCHQLGN